MIEGSFCLGFHVTFSIYEKEELITGVDLLCVSANKYVEVAFVTFFAQPLVCISYP